MDAIRMEEILLDLKGRHGNSAWIENGHREPGLSITEVKILFNCIYVLANKIEDLTAGERQQQEIIDDAFKKAKFWLEEQEQIKGKEDDSWEDINREYKKSVDALINEPEDIWKEKAFNDFQKINEELYGRTVFMIQKAFNCSLSYAADLFDDFYDDYMTEKDAAINLYAYVERQVKLETGEIDNLII